MSPFPRLGGGARELPGSVRASLPLIRGERVLAAAADDGGRWFVGTNRALYLSQEAGFRRLPWESIERAEWVRDASALVVVELADFGEPQTAHRVTLPEPGRLPNVVHERVTASMVVSRFVPVVGKRGITVVGRRPPHSDEPIAWSVVVDRGLDAESAQVRAAADRGLALARGEVGE